MIDDTELLKAYARNRDAEAFAQLVERYAGIVHAACRRICGDSADADDAAQEAFSELARQAGRIRVSVPAWLHRVATRCAWRQRARWKSAAPTPDDLAAPVIASIAETEDHARLTRRMDQAINDLPERLRNVVVMRFLDGLSQEDIAHRLRIDQATVSRRIECAVERLRFKLEAPSALLLALLRPGPVVPERMLQRLRRLAINPPSALPASGSIMSLVAATLFGAGVVLAIVTTLPLDPFPQRNAAAPPPARTMAGADSLLERLISHSVRYLDIDQVLWALQAYLRPSSGESLMRMPGEFRPECCKPIDLLCDHAPLHAILDGITAQSGWRWRELDGRILFDFPLPEIQRLALEQDLTRSVASMDVEATTLAATRLTACLDAEAAATVMRALTAPELDRAGDPRARALQAALLEAIASNPPVLMKTMAEQLPLALFAQDPGCAAGARAAWRRACAGQDALTPLLCALPGLLGLQDARLQLRQLLAAPERLATDLDPHGPLQALALENLRRFAIWSLGRLHDHAALPSILETLQRPSALDVVPSLDAIGAIQDPSAIDAVEHVDAGDDIYMQAGQYSAISCLDPARLEDLLPPRHPLPSGNSDLPLPEGWFRCGYNNQPTMVILRRLLRAPQSDRIGFIPTCITNSLLQMPTKAVSLALRAVPGDTPYQIQQRLEWRARLGEREAVKDLLATIHDPVQDGDIDRLMTLCSLMPPDQASACVVPWRSCVLRTHDTATTFALLCSAYPQALAEFLGLHAADASHDRGLLYALQWCNDPRIQGIYLANLDRDPLRVLPVIHVLGLEQQLPLRSAVEAMLQSPVLAIRHQATLTLASAFDCLGAVSDARLLTYLETLPLDQVDASLSKALVASHGTHLSARTVVEREVRLQLRWLQQAPDPKVRAAAAFWLGINMLGDLRQIRLEILQVMLTRMHTEHEGQVLDQLRLGLHALLALSPASSWYEYINEHLALGGLQDDHASIIALDALNPRIREALGERIQPAVVAPDPARPAHQGF